jgi:hypothetical protein
MTRTLVAAGVLAVLASTATTFGAQFSPSGNPRVQQADPLCRCASYNGPSESDPNRSYRRERYPIVYGGRLKVKGRGTPAGRRTGDD